MVACISGSNVQQSVFNVIQPCSLTVIQVPESISERKVPRRVLSAFDRAALVGLHVISGRLRHVVLIHRLGRHCRPS